MSEPLARISRLWRGFRTSRRVLRTLERIAVAVEEQNAYLARLADQFAPLPPAVESQADGLVKSESSVSFLNNEELAAALAYGSLMQERTGRAPTDEELVIYLAERQSMAHTQSVNERGRR